MRQHASTARRPALSGRSRAGLDWFVFFVANLQAGFGPFVAVYLTSEKWPQVDIGLVLTIGGVAGLLLQVPGGALVDASTRKRRIAAWSVVAVGISALAMALSSSFAVILIAWILHAAASCTLTPAIAAISLGLAGHEGFARRLGRNASFGSLGNAIAAGAMGGIGYWISNQAVFAVTAALMVPAVLALRRIRADEIDPVAAAAEEPSRAPAPWRLLLANRPLLILFGCLLLFYFANAAMLPLVGSALTLRSQEPPALLIAACIILPQVMVTLLSPLFGSLADRWGRKPLLILAFAVLPLKGLCFGFIHEPVLLVLAQSLDGISAAILGVVTGLVVADATRGSGHFALGQGVIGTGMGIGASASTLYAGYLADHSGMSSAFLALAVVGMAALALVITAMPETGRSHHRRESRDGGPGREPG